MNPQVTKVYPTEDYKLILTFENGEQRIFDVSPYLDKGLFTTLKDKSIFNSVRPFLGTIQWNNQLDLCPDTVYLDSTPYDFDSQGTLN